jgi:hypothetical protein
MGKPNMGFPNQAQHFFYQLWAAHQGAMLWAIWTRGYGLQEFAIWILAIWLWLYGYGIGYAFLTLGSKY